MSTADGTFDYVDFVDGLSFLGGRSVTLVAGRRAEARRRLGAGGGV